MEGSLRRRGAVRACDDEGARFPQRGLQARGVAYTHHRNRHQLRHRHRRQHRFVGAAQLFGDRRRGERRGSRGRAHQGTRTQDHHNRGRGEQDRGGLPLRSAGQPQRQGPQPGHGLGHSHGARCAVAGRYGGGGPMEKMTRVLLSALLLAATAAVGGDGIAFISNLRGEVAVDGNPRPSLLAELSRGQKITVGRDSQASVMYIASGKEYVLKGPADYLVKDTEISGADRMPPMTRDTARRTNSKVLVQVAQNSAASVRMRSFAPPKEDRQPKLLDPTP